MPKSSWLQAVLHEGTSKAMDGLSRAHMGEASACKAKLCAKLNAANL
jgi:hypothetical protein